MLSNEIKQAFEREKNHRWDQVKIRFSWINMEDAVANLYLSMRDLYVDWMGDCMLSPPNDAEIFDIQIGTAKIPNEATGGFQFIELMELIEKTWKWKKRGRKKGYVSTDIAGQKFGRLTAVRPTGERKRGYVVWECRCDCGNTKSVLRGNLVSGNTKSCGCLSRESKRSRTGSKEVTA